MKRYSYPFDKFQAEWIFTPVRNRKDVIVLLMKSIKLMLIDKKPEDKDIVGEISLVVSKMSRIFFASNNKVYSINFPFFIKESDGIIKFYNRDFPEIDSRLTSVVIELAEATNLLESTQILDFAEPIDIAAEFDQNIWSFFRELLIHEDGYLRFDNDPVNFKEGIHPLNHYDVFYTTATTFKLAATCIPNLNHLIDVLDTKTFCHTLTK